MTTTLADRTQGLRAALARLPLVAILRGLRPDDAEAIGRALDQAGFGLIEVPLNSPDPFASIATLRRKLAPATLVGAGTVTRVADVARLQALGADLVVMPHADVRVIRAAKAAGLLCVPGIATPTEAFAALDAGADALKLFPAELVTPAVMKAMRAVLPPDVPLLPVGGITPASLAMWRSAGASGFGLGSALYAPGSTAQTVALRADEFVQAWRACAPPCTTAHHRT
ncbi:MAG TPA: 2-dehydro-3-deoxy-6-phosphogalactonate aldolase [Aquabacterium sp.]|nr:2-dehydro-3-deoxy-6-phosphogalactonate aldolase [Aquabacterium sp.]HSW04392.1 2-dehydro-3-deoxy-6-phosphogalactonate aldolase [Aquabacterium sp.]